MRTSVIVASITALFAMLLALAMPAAADAPGESDESAQLVREAIALIVNTPGNMDAVDEKIVDAEKAPKQDGVDLDIVRQAGVALQRGDMHQARLLLERSIGAQPHRGASDPLPIGRTRGTPGMTMASGSQSGTDVAIDALAPDRHLSGADWLGLAGLSLLAAIGGWLAARFRPRVNPDDDGAP